MKHLALTLVLACILTFIAGTAHASDPSKYTPKFQLSATPTLVLNFDDTKLGGIVGGGAVVFPLLPKIAPKRLFLRLYAGGGSISPFIQNPPAIPVVRGVTVLGFTPVARVNILLGVGVVAVFPKNLNPKITPIGVAGVNLWVKPGVFSVGFPTVITKEGVVLNAEFTITFPSPNPGKAGSGSAGKS